jgi:hypothetical protein
MKFKPRFVLFKKPTGEILHNSSKGKNIAGFIFFICLFLLVISALAYINPPSNQGLLYYAYFISMDSIFLLLFVRSIYLFKYAGMWISDQDLTVVYVFWNTRFPLENVDCFEKDEEEISIIITNSASRDIPSFYYSRKRQSNLSLNYQDWNRIINDTKKKNEITTSKISNNEKEKMLAKELFLISSAVLVIGLAISLFGFIIIKEPRLGLFGGLIAGIGMFGFSMYFSNKNVIDKDDERS